MKRTSKENYIFIEPENEDITGFSSFITKHHDDFKESNVLVNLLDYGELQTEDLLSFLELSNVHRTGKKSFVLAGDAASMDKVPDELVVVPTIQEAEDIIRMDELERELGF
ncbi:ribonuclease Z [Salegentibacter chungangensis]|uniref:Ribonuclease Z n=1 Tax=Salegentibacter chungangensis TaxID=1335724 RepID=A0ABW3NSS3_9FLAO